MRNFVQRRLSVLLLILAFCIGPWLLSAGQSNGAVQQYACNRAAVVMIRTEVLAEVNVQKININPKTFNRLLDSIRGLEADSIFLTPAEKLDIVLEEFQRRPQRYFVNEFNYFRHREKVTARGSGFIISGNGYVLTNCHVVDEGDAYINRRFILSAFNYVTETNISSIEQEWEVKFTELQRSLLYRTFANVYSQIVPIELEKVEKKIYVVINMDDSLGRKSSQAIPARIIRKGRSMPGKDVAILKIETPFELPVIPLAASNESSVGEDIYVYGYPNPVLNNEYLSNETVLEPTLTKGIVSGWKKTINGWPVFQMDAGINHGNSGGPVCNKYGQAIGISTFGSLDDNTRGLAAGLNFAIPLEVIREFFSDSIVPANNQVSVDFCKGLQSYQKKYFKVALHSFKNVEKTNSSYPGLHAYINSCLSNIAQGNDSSPRSSVYYLLIALFILIAGGLAWLKLRSK